MLTGLAAARVRAEMAARVFAIALQMYDTPARAWEALGALRALERRMLPDGRRLRVHRGRVFSRLAGPGFPSRAFDRAVEVELNHCVAYRPGFDLPIALVAVTRHCALHCQHCSEWDTLRQDDPLTVPALVAEVAALRGRGVSHLELTGGEPLQRLDAVEAIARDASGDCDVWVLTSGVPLTAQHARQLDDAGVTGVMVSLDHWNAARHDAFRGVHGAWDRALRGLTLAREAGLLTGVSITVTRETATRDDLLAIADLARAHGAAFVRVLEPHAAGRWAHADIGLTPAQLATIDAFPAALRARWPDDAPVVQNLDALRRRAGCQGAGERYVFVDAAGDVHACPFCHGAAGSCLGGLDAALARLRGSPCGADGEGALVALRSRRAEG